MSAANIGSREIWKRMVFGAIMLAAGVVLAAVLFVSHASRSSRLFLFVPFWMAGLGLLQAREKT